MNDTILKNGLVVTPGGVIRGGVAIKGERIVAIGADESLGQAREVVDMAGKIVFPGIFDPHFHLGNGDEVGYDAMREDFYLESKEMAVAGVTLFATTTLYGKESLVESFDKTLACGENNSFVDYKVTCCVSVEEHIAQMAPAAARGCVDFKFFIGYKGLQAESLGMSSDGITLGIWYKACREMARIGRPVFPKIHAEDPWVREILLDEIRKAGREDYLVAWAEHSPGYGENLQIYSAAVIAHQFRVPLYVVHVSAKESPGLIRYLRKEGMNIIAETTPAFLCGDARELEAAGLKGRAKIQPPIRFKEDSEALWAAVERGEITIIGTDSLPYSTKYKDSAGFWDLRVGLNCQVPATIPLMMTEGVEKGRIDLTVMAKLLSENAAKLYGIYPLKGAIQVGSDADLVIIDPEKEGKLGADKLRGKSDYSIWEGRPVRGFPVMTFVRGRLVARDGEVVADKPDGRHIVGVKPRGM
ncbi:MAG: L-hydantoinase [Syntrophorhabdaceae bacterium PtaU1.Bin034]|nr:MAG: L-hydantoinase [Syntrophorhabdaceae bacterium PtaU1.Bin034]